MMKSVFPTRLLVLLCFTLLSVACASPPVQQHTIEMAQMKFIPAEIIVHKGDQITFVNHDLVLHNVTDSLGKSLIDSLRAGASQKITISESFNYYCSLHPVMKGKVVVN